MAFENSAGIGTRTNYGVRKINEKFGGKQASDVIQYVEVVFDYDDLPTAGAEMEALIPAYSLIKSAYLQVITPFAGGTSYNIGLAQTNGTAVDADGLFAAIATASLTPAGKWNAGTGALVGAGIGANPCVITVAATGTFTAGKARLVVEYIPGTV
jgi:hypothetical protein